MSSNSETSYIESDEELENKKLYNTVKPQGHTIKSSKKNHLKVVKLYIFIKFYEKEIVIPEFQRPKNKIKIKNIKKCLKDDIDIICHLSNAIQIAFFNNIYFLLDGQHRVQAFKELLDENEINKEIEINVNIIKCESLEDMKRFYNHINVDRVNIDEYNNNNVESIIIDFKYKELKNELANRYKQTFYLDLNIYSLDEYIDELKKIGFLEKFNININNALSFLIENNDKYAREYYTEDKIKELKLTKRVLGIIYNGKILSLKNNNFIRVLLNDKLKFKHN